MVPVCEYRKQGALATARPSVFILPKYLGALGDGGAVTTNDDTVAEKIRMLRNYGSSLKYYNEMVGVNSPLDEVLAALLSIKLVSLDRANEHKRKLATLYDRGLSDRFCKHVRDEDYFDVHHIYNTMHPRPG